MRLQPVQSWQGRRGAGRAVPAPCLVVGAVEGGTDRHTDMSCSRLLGTANALQVINLLWGINQLNQSCLKHPSSSLFAQTLSLEQSCHGAQREELKPSSAIASDPDSTDQSFKVGR